MQGSVTIGLIGDYDAAVPARLDNLIPSRVAPVLVAFVSRPEWGDRPPPDEEIEDAVANLLAHDVAPFLDGRYRTDPRPEKRALVGTGFAAWRAAYSAFRHPTVFGALGLQSLSMLDTDQDLLAKQVSHRRRGPAAPLLDWGRYDRRGCREALTRYSFFERRARPNGAGRRAASRPHALSREGPATQSRARQGR